MQEENRSMTNSTIAQAEAWNEELAWQQLLARDQRGRFYYGVLTTGVFCRPGCASRRPRRENTRFFSSIEAATEAGFRACQRCRPSAAPELNSVTRMCAYLEHRLDRQVTLSELGKAAGVSPFTAQRAFKKAIGVSPSAYQRAMRASALRQQLQSRMVDETGPMSKTLASDTRTITAAIYEAGYGSSSRVYEASPLGMTPASFLAGGRGERIGFAVAEAPELGWIVVGATARGVCWLAITGSADEAEQSLRQEFPAAEITPDAALEQSVSDVIAGLGDGNASSLPLDLRGTAFQLRVWKALTEIPSGQTKTYSQLAAELGNPNATRAVARACALNRVSVLVPCHRVVGVSGSLTGYRWGVERKRKLLHGEGVRG